MPAPAWQSAMQAINLPLHATRLLRDDDHGLLLNAAAPQATLRVALITRGAERHIFPALALDDWGREKKGLSLYQWLYEEGTRFPRAELFGFDAFGHEAQLFLRDLELSYRYPCYVYDVGDAPIAAGQRLHTVFVPGEPGQTEPSKIAPPHHLPFALHRAAIRWRQVDPAALPALRWRPFPPPP